MAMTTDRVREAPIAGLPSWHPARVARVNSSMVRWRWALGGMLASTMLLYVLYQAVHPGQLGPWDGWRRHVHRLDHRHQPALARLGSRQFPASV